MEPSLCSLAKTFCKHKVVELIEPNGKYLFDRDEVRMIFGGDSKMEKIVLCELCGEQWLFQKSCLAGDEGSTLYLLPYVSDLNCVSPMGNALVIAVSCGYTSIVDILLKNNVIIPDPIDFDLIDLESCKCCFFLSAFNGWIVILQLLVNYREDIFKEARHCVNVLKFACFGGHSVILLFCIEKFNNIVAEKAILEEFIQSEVLLEICLHNCHTNLVSFIIDKGAKLSKNIIARYDKSVIEYLSSGIKKKELYVNIDWRYKSLQDLSVNWIIPYHENLLELDLSFNEINILPTEVPWILKSLKRFVLKHSSLYGMAPPKEDGIFCTSLEYMDVSNNELMHIPSEIFSLTNLKILNVENNHIQVLSSPNSEWKCLELEQLMVGGNNILDFPTQINKCFALKRICFKGNRLNHFIQPWDCPLRILDLSHNVIEHFCETIGNLESSWNKTLKEVLFSNNLLSEVPNFILKLEALEVLNLSNNMLKSLPHPDAWSSKFLRILNLSHNNLGCNKTNRHQLDVSIASDAQYFTQRSFNLKFDTPLELPLIFSNFLVELYLNDNNLTFVPLSITCMKKLTKLDLSYNKEIEDIPPELTNLYHLEHLVIDHNDFKDANLNQLICKGCSTKELLAYLRQRYRKFTTFNRLRCIILGKKSNGKTSLVKSLSNNQASSIAKFSVVELQWDCSSFKLKHFFSRPLLDISDLSVQLTVIPETFSIDFKPLYSQDCLYLVVFDLRLHKNTDEFLCTKLCDLQAQIPNAYVIVVGTFLDCLCEGRDVLKNVKSSIINKYSTKAGFPQILDIIFVSNIGNKEGILLLRTAIITAFYKLNLGVVLDHHHSDPKLRRRFPKDYLELSKEILRERDVRKLCGKCPLLNENEFKTLLRKVKHAGGMLYTREDRDLVEKFLKDAGYVINFPKYFGRLSNWYFIDIQWLGNVLMEEQNFKDCLKLLNGGTISTDDVKLVFDFEISSNHHKEFSIEEEIQLLEAFGIIHKLFNDGYLISQKIPVECLDVNINPPQANGKTFFRFYKMNVIPGGIFKNLLVRLIGWFQASKQGLDINNLKSTFKQFSPFTNISYWQKGFVLETEIGFLKVEAVSYSDCIYNLASDGLVIYAQAIDRRDSLMELQNIFCSTIDLTNDLIEQNYPGLVDDGCLNTFAICPYHLKEKNDLNLIELFTCAKVILASRNFLDLFISCPSKQRCKVPLKYLVPDLLLCDLPLKFNLNINEVSYSAEKDILGQGGEGIVFRGELRGLAVAVKQNEIMMTDCIKSLKDITYKTENEEFLKQKVTYAFRNYRHESSMLSKLKHPCIVSLLGFCAATLTYVMELCPIGSLRSLLNSDFNKITFYNKYKICSQIISALKYLHNQKLVYKDMKPENILVWSLHNNDLVNVKLSDYGLIKRLFASGIKGIEGTSGYQAPEIWLNRPYNEKVDVFAFSMVAYELFTGDRSFLENSSMTIKKQIKQGKRPVIDAGIKLFPKIRNFITRSWDHEPEKRPNAEELDQMMRDLSFIMLEEVVVLQEHGVIGALSAVCVDQNEAGHFLVGFQNGDLNLYTFHKLSIQLICTTSLTKVFPVNTLTLISSSIWVTCGPEIYISKLSQFNFKTEFVIRTRNPSKGTIVADLCHHGDQVWCAYDPAGIIVEIDLETLDIICTLNCKEAFQDCVISSFDCQDLITSALGVSSPESSKDTSETVFPKYLSSRQKRSIKRSMKKQISRIKIEPLNSSQIRSISHINGILWVILENCKVILINVTRENMFNYDYGQVLNIMTSHRGRDDEVGADTIIKVEDVQQPKIIVAKVYNDEVLPYKTVQLESWIGLDLATTHSYLTLHKQLQDINSTV